MWLPATVALALLASHVNEVCPFLSKYGVLLECCGPCLSPYVGVLRNHLSLLSLTSREARIYGRSVVPCLLLPGVTCPLCLGALSILLSVGLLVLHQALLSPGCSQPPRCSPGVPLDPKAHPHCSTCQQLETSLQAHAPFLSL